MCLSIIRHVVPKKIEYSTKFRPKIGQNRLRGGFNFSKSCGVEATFFNSRSKTAGWTPKTRFLRGGMNFFRFCGVDPNFPIFAGWNTPERGGGLTPPLLFDQSVRQIWEIFFRPAKRQKTKSDRQKSRKFHPTGKNLEKNWSDRQDFWPIFGEFHSNFFIFSALRAVLSLLSC